jgi:uncharacterized RDD family membrane protein YckC
MSSTEPPIGSTPPPGEPTPPPPPPAHPATVPPPDQAAAPPPPPPPPPTGAAAPGPGAPNAAYGPGSPGNLLDRFLARLIDGILVGIVSVIITIVLTAASDSFILTGVVSSIVTAALYLGYFAYLESTRGQTLGKQILKLKVVGPDGVTVPTMEQAIRRNIWTAFGIAGVIPVLGALLGGLAELAAVILIAVGINGDAVRRQHWFDKFAGGTQVLKVG